jgi:hypothetical protein
VRNLERAGVSRSAAMAMVGHRTASIYRRYAIVDEAMLLESAEKLAAFHSANKGTQRKVVPLKPLKFDERINKHPSRRM